MRRGQSGQTLIMFAITMVFMFISLIALVGDADTLMVRYNEVNAEALLAAQTGATDVDRAGLYDLAGPRYQLAADAWDQCQKVPTGPNTNMQISCTQTANTVTAVVSWQVTLPIPLGMSSATVRATRTGQAVFGGAQAVNP